MTGPAIASPSAMKRSRRMAKPKIGARTGAASPRWRWPAARRSATRRLRKRTTALYATSQSNLTSLSEVVEKHPDDPQAYNMRGSVYGEAGRNEQALADFNKAISLDPNYAQAYANRALVYGKTDKLDLALADYNKALSIDALCVRLSRPRHRLPPARPQGAGAQRFQQGDRASARQCAGLLQSRPALSEPASASVRHRRLLHRARALPAEGRTVRRARAQLSGNRRRQVGGERSRRGGADGPAKPARPGPAAASPTSASGRRTRPPAPMRRRSISTRNTSRQRPASPGSAARLGRRTRRFEPAAEDEERHDHHAQPHHRPGARQGRSGQILRPTSSVSSACAPTISRRSRSTRR